MNRSMACSLLLVTSALAPVYQAAAQTGAVDRAQLSRDQSALASGPTVTTTAVDGDTHVVTSPNDPDLGEQQILKRNDTYDPFVVAVSVPFYWTSNVALTNSGEQDDFLVSPVVAIAYQPR